MNLLLEDGGFVAADRVLLSGRRLKHLGVRIMGFGGISTWQLLIVLLIGSKRLKGLGSDLGDTIKGFRKPMGNDDKPAVEEPKGQTIDAHARTLEDAARKY